MVTRLSLCFLLFSPSLVFAFGDNNPIGARSAGIANSSVSISDVWSSHHNQAGLGFVEKLSAGIYYESRYLVSELGLKAGVFALPVRGGVFGLSATSFGYSKYSESKYGLAYAKKFGEKFSVGIQLNYLNTRIAENYGTKGVLTGEIGVQTKISDNLTLGTHIFNINQSKLVDYNQQRVPTIIRFGGNYTFSDKVFWALEVEKDSHKKPVLKTGIEYHVIDILYLRVGVSSNPFLYSYGFGLKLNKFKLDFSSNVHSVLGYTPQLSLSCQID